jgi:UDP-N-acetylmuramoylalanine--D-glutamate ligase
MGRSGLAVSGLLRSHGLDVFASDANPEPPMGKEFDRLGIPSETGRHSIERFTRAEEIVVSPGVPLDIDSLNAARVGGVPVVSELEVASRYLLGDVVAVTGSNGKTTTTSLVAAILGTGARPVQVGGNIGIAVSDLVSGSTHETINVLEVSSFQLDGSTRFRPRVGVLLNITPDHLDRYADFEAYRMAKFKLFENQTEEEFAVINMDDPQSFPLPVEIASRQRFFSRKEQFDRAAGLQGQYLSVRGHRVIQISELSLRGSHNVENVLASILVADVYGITPEQMAEAIRDFKGVEHRLETVATVNGVEFVNDSKATNVDSAVKALEAFDLFDTSGASEANIILIVGGRDKEAPLEPLVRAMHGRVRQVISLGEAAEKLERAIGAAVPTRRVRSIAEAVDLAIESGRSGDVVLLAPACSSFDMYAGYEERGRDFKKAVRSHMRVKVSDK